MSRSAAFVAVPNCPCAEFAPRQYSASMLRPDEKTLHSFRAIGQAIPNLEHDRLCRLRVSPARVAQSNQGKLAAEEGLGIAFRRATLHASQSREPKKRFGVEPLLGALSAKMGNQKVDFTPDGIA